jgi:FSR family fosmidomycin resistance protein-like MFS transporter
MAFTVLAAFIYLKQPVAAVIFLGLGNAAFHVGGGVISLNLTPQKATAPGIFVAPGALGLLAGTLLGKSGDFSALTALHVMIVLAFLMFVIRKPEIYRLQQPVPKDRSYAFEVVIGLVLFSIAIRSLGGTVLVFPGRRKRTCSSC